MVPLKQEKSKEQLTADLTLLQKDMEKECAAQERFIRQCQRLVQAEGDLAALIGLLPCPAAVFEVSGALCAANGPLIEHTDLSIADIASGKINFLGRVTDENYAIQAAAEGVFYGKTALLSRLSYVLEMFCKGWSYTVSDHYHRALLFPLPDKAGRIPYGAIMLLR